MNAELYFATTLPRSYFRHYMPTDERGCITFFKNMSMNSSLKYNKCFFYGCLLILLSTQIELLESIIIRIRRYCAHFYHTFIEHSLETVRLFKFCGKFILKNFSFSLC